MGRGTPWSKELEIRQNRTVDPRICLVHGVCAVFVRHIAEQPRLMVHFLHKFAQDVSCAKHYDVRRTLEVLHVWSVVFLALATTRG